MVKSEGVGYYPDVGGKGPVKETLGFLAQRKKTVAKISSVSVEGCVGNRSLIFQHVKVESWTAVGDIK